MNNNEYLMTYRAFHSSAYGDNFNNREIYPELIHKQEYLCAKIDGYY